MLIHGEEALHRKIFNHKESTKGANCLESGLLNMDTGNTQPSQELQGGRSGGRHPTRFLKPPHSHHKCTVWTPSQIKGLLSSQGANPKLGRTVKSQHGSTVWSLWEYDPQQDGLITATTVATRWEGGQDLILERTGSIVCLALFQALRYKDLKPYGDCTTDGKANNIVDK